MPIDHDTSLSAFAVTALLDRWQAGEAAALETLVPLLYRELRRLAGQRMLGEAVHHTLQPTALVHEVWLRLVDQDRSFANRAHFFAAAALAMRGILIDHARRLRAARHGGGHDRLFFDEVEVVDHVDGLIDALALGEALQQLDALAPAPATVATMRFLLGCSVAETAQALGVSQGKVKKDWAFARAWLRRFLRRGDFE